MKNLPVNVITGTVYLVDCHLEIKHLGHMSEVAKKTIQTASLTNFEFLKVCWCCLLKNIKSSPCLLKLQLVKVGAFFETQCRPYNICPQPTQTPSFVSSFTAPSCCHGNAARYANIYNGCRKMQRRRNHMTARGVFSCLVVELAVADICRPCRPFILYPR